MTKQQALARLRSLVSEIWTAHRDHTDHEAYNECDVAECAWCEDTRKALAILESPDEPSVPQDRNAAMAAGLPFIHWSKDPLIPYEGCTCSSCEGMRQYRTNLSGGTL